LDAVGVSALLSPKGVLKVLGAVLKVKMDPSAGVLKRDGAEKLNVLAPDVEAVEAKETALAVAKENVGVLNEELALIKGVVEAVAKEKIDLGSAVSGLASVVCGAAGSSFGAPFLTTLSIFLFFKVSASAV